MRISPSSAITAPVRILMRVDLPAPFSPTMAWTSPARSSREACRSAATPPYDLRIPRASRSIQFNLHHWVNLPTMELMSILPALLAGLLFQQPVQESIVVTGSYQPVPLNETDRAVTLLPLTPKTVLLYNSITDLFKLDSSLDLQQRAPNDVQGDLSIRGGTFGQTLVLLNGMRLNDAQSGHHDLDIPVPIEAIQQVEVLQGSGSNQYGSDAVGGVVNVVTRHPDGLEADLRAALGNFGTNQEALTLGAGTKKYSELLSVLSGIFSTGFTADRDYRNLSLSSNSMFSDPLGSGSILLALRDSPFGAPISSTGTTIRGSGRRSGSRLGIRTSLTNTESGFRPISGIRICLSFSASRPRSIQIITRTKHTKAV